jgi:hypothetical protein
MSWVSIGVSVAGSILSSSSSKKEAAKQAKIAREEGKFAAGLYIYNSELDRQNALEAVRAGMVQDRQISRQFGQDKGTFKARGGATLGSVHSATMEQVLEYQSRMEDEQRREALRESFTQSVSFESSALHNKRLAGKALRDGQSGAILYKMQGNNQAVGSLLTGAGQALSIYSNRPQ